MSSSSTGASSSRDACACGSAFSSEHPFGTASSHGSNTFGVAFTNGETLAPAGSSTVFGPATTSSLSSASVHGQNLNLFGTAPTSRGFSPPIFGKSNDCFGTAPTSPGFSPPVFRQSNVCFGTAPTSPLFSPPIFRQSNDCFWTAPSPGFSPPIFGQSNDCFGTRTSSGFTAPRTSSVFGGSGFTAPRTSSVFGGSGFIAPRTSSGFGGRGLTTPRTSSMFGGSGFTAPRTSSVFGGSGFIAPRTRSRFTAPRTSCVFGGSGFTAPRTSSGFTAPFVEQSSNCWRTSSCSAVTSEFGQIGYSPFFPTSMQAVSSSPIHGSLLGDQVKTISGHSSFFGPTFGVNRGGSRSASYTATDMEGVSPHEAGRILSISAMPVYKDKCHEELRWEDYQFAAGTWGKMPVFDSFRPAEAPIGSQSKGSKVEPYTRTQIDDAMATSISAMPVYRDKSHEELRWEDYQFNGSGGRLDSASVQFNATGYPVDKTSSSFLNTVPSNSFFQPNPFSPPKSRFQTCNPFASNNLFNNPHGDPYTSITQSPLIAGPHFPVSHPHPSDISLSAGAASLFGPNLFNCTSFVPSASNSSTSVAAPVTASVPCNFPPTTYTVTPSSTSCTNAAPPAVCQVSAEGPRTTSLRSGLSSSIPVLPLADAHKTPTTASKELPVQMRDNSRALVSGPPEKCNIRVKFENMSIIRNTSIHVCENGEVSVELSTPSVDGSIHQVIDGKSDEAFTAGKSVVNGDNSLKKEISSNVYELMPKVKHSEYFTEPRVEELALKESLEPGFCSHVKDFVVGHGRYGSIKFLGETDVRRLDINSHIVFSDHEVVVYMDESKKPPVGQGLNKAAEITLCNIKCIDKDGNQYINGPKVDEYKQKLIKFAADEGAEYVSYDPVQGEWKFRVEHF